MRITLLLALLGLALWMPKFLQEHPVELQIERLQTQLNEITRANDLLKQDNERYRTLVRGLREDPRVMERRARETLGMSRADEIVIWFPEDGPPSPPPR